MHFGFSRGVWRLTYDLFQIVRRDFRDRCSQQRVFLCHGQETCLGVIWLKRIYAPARCEAVDGFQLVLLERQKTVNPEGVPFIIYSVGLNSQCLDPGDLAVIFEIN